ncbi:xanthine dehydrogenase family protein molybdopterin-binding subunit [Paracoccus fistulariae]|uniref:Xanthine dehydrogenase family protein molybdopterin-binding subunit n=1 Tax=Paracoccus fistulariae TaxID=658446 RepID=A0ABY7SJE1_9RHOB|nr:molybdopterin cofactor-binding domain-containing protein [Paracoccus fistulariae]MDB6180718.1 molybdopterin-dependent oxidoreductase [Paracoccus fistulariae]WCR07053.1 xanthine dehydrogenase family protein molybdopterin-binding subunit [Paracoccus fistulariae]
MTAMHTTRRGFLAGSAGLMLALTLPLPKARAQQAAAEPFAPNAFIRIGTDDTVTVMIKHLEMGQGPYTGLSTLVAEELDADWSQMRAEGAPANAELYNNLAFGPMQGTGGSTAIANSYIQMRKAGAAARAMLVAAAAQEWGVPAEEITVKAGVISHEGSGNSSGFGALSQLAASQTVPEDPPLKEAKDFVLIGTDLPKLDTAAKTTGKAEFTMDIFRDGMLTVVVAHPPKFGATVASFDDSAALQVSGVEMVRQIPSGVAVYATNTYAAMKGRDALSVEWDDSAAETRSSAEMFEEYAQALAEGGQTVEEHEDIAVLDDAAQVLEAEYRFPYLAHAPLEPLDAVIEVKEGKAEMWYGCQFPTLDHMTVAQVLEMPQEDVRINVLMAGGSFGRRAQGTSHLAAEAAAIAKAAGRDGAFKLVWTREDDVKGGYYRPMTIHKLRAGLDADGNIIGWENIVANQSILMGSAMEGMLQGGPDTTSYEGSSGLPYNLGAKRIGWARMQSPVSVLWWRSVGHTHTGYAVEAFLDEVLEAAGKDPVQGRLDLLPESETRVRGVIEKVAEISGWNGTTRDGKGYGVAYVKSFGTHVAQVVELEDRGGVPHLTKVWCAVDCGVAVNPNVIRAQMEGGIGFALGTALHDRITFAPGGEVQQSNYHNYPMLRIGEMPEVEVAIIQSDADPTGVGEPGVPPLAPAMANAWRALTGNKQYELPFSGVTS